MTSPERLETGWLPETPLGDNLVHHALVNLADSCRHYAASLQGRLTVTDDATLIDLNAGSAYFNSAVLRRPVLSADDPLLDEIDVFYGHARETPAMVWSAFPTPDLGPRGWELVGHPPLMLLPAGSAPPPALDPPGGELRIDEATDAAGIAAFESVLVEGYPLEELTPYRPGCLFDERVLGRGFRAWVGRVDGEPVAAAAAHVFGGLTGVEWVATLATARGRGYGRALTWRAATCEPGQHAVLNSSDAGRRMYERMGFIAVLRYTLWNRPPPAGVGRGAAQTPA